MVVLAARAIATTPDAPLLPFSTLLRRRWSEAKARTVIHPQIQTPTTAGLHPVKPSTAQSGEKAAAAVVALACGGVSEEGASAPACPIITYG